MAWRLDKSVIKGEIDNRVAGRVTGRIWLLNRPEPIVLELKGNGYRDLAGSLLRFENPRPDEGDDTRLQPLQVGEVGDMTASRKVRVLDLPVEEAYLKKKRGEEVPEHMGNCVYLEWFSRANGRVVIESVDYRTEITGRAWTMSEAQEDAQRTANAGAMGRWMERLGEALEQRREEADEPGEDRPMNEYEWEMFLRESDQRTDKLAEVEEKYRDHPDAERLIAREMGWDWLEEALDADRKGVFDEERKARAMEPDEPLEPNPLTEGTDWVRRENGRIVHPLQDRAFQISTTLWRECKEQGLLENGGNPGLRDMLLQAQTLSAKLAGALNALAYRDGPPDGGFIVAYLKRALVYLNEALAAAQAVEEAGLLDPTRLDRFRQDLLGIREEMYALMEKYRGAI